MSFEETSLVHTASTLALACGLHVDLICPGEDGENVDRQKTDRLVDPAAREQRCQHSTAFQNKNKN